MGVLSYDRKTVERVLPGVWDDDCMVNGFRSEEAPDHDMPTMAVDHSKGGGNVIAITDVRQAWKYASLTHRQRQALLVRYGLDEQGVDGALVLGIAKRNFNSRLERGVGTLVNWLNGVTDEEQDEEE